ncbi:MAG: catalase family peroxidase [Dongiaceae bacterium]
MKLIRLATGLAVAACMLAASARAPSARAADDTPPEVQAVDAINKAFGRYPGLRANHAKGVMAEGSFKASPEAAGLSRAALFGGAAIPVTVRFSDASGLPNLPDGSPIANPHGLAIKYHLPDGSETDMVTNSLKVFVVATGDEFRDLFLAVAASPPGAPQPTRLDQFIASHPRFLPNARTAATPDSFADEQYNGLDAFILVNKAGQRQAVRYMIVPERLVHLSEADAAKQAPDFLVKELPERLKSGPVTFHLKAQLAAAGDQTKDPTQAWPEDRPVVDLGVLTIERPVADSAAAEKKIVFLPGLVTDGIELSDDPLVNFRDGAYAESFSRRSQ